MKTRDFFLTQADEKYPKHPAYPLHSPEVPQEKVRIYNSKGEIKMSTTDMQHKIYVRARMYPGLPITRSLGDILAHHIGVTSEPNIVIKDLTGEEKFLTVATDGVWRHFGA